MHNFTFFFKLIQAYKKKNRFFSSNYPASLFEISMQ